MNTIFDVFLYIEQAPYFWGSMGFIVAIAMLVGTLIFEGDYRQIYKFILSLGAYTITILVVNFMRASKAIAIDATASQKAMAYAASGTILIVSFFWIIGLFLGLTIHKIRIKRL